MTHPLTPWQQHLKTLGPTQKQHLRRRIVQDVMERDHWICAAVGLLSTPCRGTLTAHEVVQKSVRWSSYWEADLQVTACHFHHMWIHDNIAASEKLGLLRRSHEVDADGVLLPMETQEARA